MMNNVDHQYLSLCEKILKFGVISNNRTGVRTYSLFGETMKFSLQDGFPILTSKKINFLSPLNELLWMLSGSTNVNDLPKESQFIWKAWADKDGELGKIYGKQMRDFHGVDQIEKIQWQLKNEPESRRIVLNLWNVDELPSMALEPCHLMTIFRVLQGKLNCHVTLRSNDIPIGNPYNIVFYALLTHMLASVSGLSVGDLFLSITDAHIYENQIEKVNLQISRKNDIYDLPKLLINNQKKNILHFTSEDFSIIDYKHHPFIKFPVAV